MKTEVVLKCIVSLTKIMEFMFNENRSCIEILICTRQLLITRKFNENRSCIEIA